MTIRTNVKNSLFHLNESTYQTTYKKKPKVYIFHLRTRLKIVHWAPRRYYVPDVDDNGKEILELYNVYKLVHSVTRESIVLTTTDQVDWNVWKTYEELLDK